MESNLGAAAVQLQQSLDAFVQVAQTYLECRRFSDVTESYTTLRQAYENSFPDRQDREAVRFQAWIADYVTKEVLALISQIETVHSFNRRLKAQISSVGSIWHVDTCHLISVFGLDSLKSRDFNRCLILLAKAAPMGQIHDKMSLVRDQRIAAPGGRRGTKSRFVPSDAAAVMLSMNVSQRRNRHQRKLFVRRP